MKPMLEAKTSLVPLGLVMHPPSYLQKEVSPPTDSPCVTAPGVCHNTTPWGLSLPWGCSLAKPSAGTRALCHIPDPTHHIPTEKKQVPSPLLTAHGHHMGECLQGQQTVPPSQPLPFLCPVFRQKMGVRSCCFYFWVWREVVPGGYGKTQPSIQTHLA